MLRLPSAAEVDYKERFEKEVAFIGSAQITGHDLAI